MISRTGSPSVAGKWEETPRRSDPSKEVGSNAQSHSQEDLDHITAEYLDGLFHAGGPPPRLFTVGYGGRKPEELTSLLRRHGVITVVDVRLRPDRAALGAYAKAKTPDKGIEKLMREAGLNYVSLVELGNLFVDLDDWQRRYGDLLEAAGPILIPRLVGFPTPSCLLCCEKDPVQCHRRLIAEYLARKGWTVEHIL